MKSKVRAARAEMRVRLREVADWREVLEKYSDDPDCEVEAADARERVVAAQVALADSAGFYLAARAVRKAARNE